MKSQQNNIGSLNLVLQGIEDIKGLLLDKQDETLNLSQVSEYLNLSKSTLYKLTMKGAIPHYKPCGKKIYFSKKEIDKWVKEYHEKEEV
jgi:excisionase family DNA binding protein